jgi:hypothetical protein
MNEGLVEQLSRFLLDETVGRLENTWRVKAIKIFARRLQNRRSVSRYFLSHSAQRIGS